MESLPLTRNRDFASGGVSRRPSRSCKSNRGTLSIVFEAWTSVRVASTIAAITRGWLWPRAAPI